MRSILLYVIGLVGFTLLGFGWNYSGTNGLLEENKDKLNINKYELQMDNFEENLSVANAGSIRTNSQSCNSSILITNNTFGTCTSQADIIQYRWRKKVGLFTVTVRDEEGQNLSVTGPITTYTTYWREARCVPAQAIFLEGVAAISSTSTEWKASNEIIFPGCDLCPDCDADAGPNQSICPGASVTLGGNASGHSLNSPIATSRNSDTYSWSPSTGLSCTNCPNPTATLSTSQTYTLTVNCGGGSSCDVTDQVTVSPQV